MIKILNYLQDIGQIIPLFRQSDTSLTFDPEENYDDVRVIFEKIKIDIPLLDAIQYIPHCSKILKEVCTLGILIYLSGGHFTYGGRGCEV